MNCMKLTQLPRCVDQVRAWQRYLKSRGMYSGSINGSSDSATNAATEKYRQKTGKRGDDIFCLSFERPDKEHFQKKDGDVVLNDPIRAVLRPVAFGYYLLTDKDLVVTSGLRTPKEQAAEMYKKAKHSLSDLSVYNNHTLDPIKKAYEEKTKAGAGEQATIDAMTTVISDQVKNHYYISRHPYGPCL